MPVRSPVRTRSYRPSLERLEDRIQMAAGITATLGADGTLTIEGTDGADTIALWQSSGYLEVIGAPIATPNGSVNWLSVTRIQGIVVNGLGGNDRIVLDQTRYGSAPVKIPATVNGGAGDDYIVGDQASDLLVAGDGNDTLIGHGSSDTLVDGAGYDCFFAGSGSGVLQGGTGVNFFDRGTGNPTLVKSGTQNFVADQWAVGGAAPEDVVQENAPLCSFLASLASVAMEKDAALANHITYLGNGVYGVQLFQAGATAGTGQWITEDVTFNGRVTSYDPEPVSDGKFWVVLYQRAWVQERWAQGLSPIAWPGDALTALTGETSYVFPGSNGWYIFPAVYYGYNVVASTYNTQSAISSLLVPNHAYTVMGMDSSGNIVLRNPWGIDGGQTTSGSPSDGLITISWADFSKSMVAYWIC